MNLPKLRFLRALAALALGAAATLARPAAVDVKLDAAQTGQPISPYVYGQFIEHLGRCIYGGIWAEMLQDRKFYFPITADYAPYKDLQNTPFPVVGASPWEIVGSADGVAMTTVNPFVGDHTPRISIGHGLRQHDLGVAAGQEYTGYIWAKPEGATPAEIELTLTWGNEPGKSATEHASFAAGDYTKKPFRFRATAANDHATLEIRAVKGDVLVGTLSLMPADNVRGMRRDTLALLKQLGGTIYRWPGGNFTSGYDWRDGIGDRDRRPPRKNPAWTGVEHNDFGTDEFIDFCREIGTEPLIAANTGFGDAHSAAEWVEYCNGKADTEGGAIRVRLGHPQAYGVKRWCVGNEMFGPWQLGFMQLNQYVIKHNEVAKKMHAADPSLILVAVGDLEQINKDYDPQQAKRGIGWSQGMLEACSDNMDFLSEHFYRGRVPWEKNARVDLLTSVTQLKDAIRHKADGHRKLQPSLPQLKGRFIPISMDEWNYWHLDYVYGELGCVYDLSDTLGVAEGLNEYYRQTDVIHMAFYAQTVNVIGAIKTNKTAAEMEGTGLVLSLYRHHYGSIPLKIAQDFAPLDIGAALSTDRHTLTVSVINPTKADVSVQLSMNGEQVSGPATRWHITGADEFVHNAPGQPRQIDITRTNGLDAKAPLTVPSLSCALFEIPVTE